MDAPQKTRLGHAGAFVVRVPETPQSLHAVLERLMAERGDRTLAPPRTA